MTAIIDGQTQNFNTSLQGTHQGVAYVIEGRASASDTFPVMQMVLIKPDSLAIGTFTDTTIRYTVSCILGINDTTRYNSGTGATGPGINTNPTMITITAQDATSIQGTFSGDFYLNNTLTGKKTITGDFDVPWK